MPASLGNYWRKRDFGITSEPKGKVARAGRKLSFVIQKHAATRLHYDFRLEIEGTLKSWAVPKGPSLDPSIRRMAMHTEDHPMDYASFDGVIPKGQYGAGTVIVWDRGDWTPVGDPVEGYRKGKLKFDLHGEKLHGRWNLVRMRRAEGSGEPWLLIKENDEEARPASEYDIVEALPDSVLSKPRRKAPARGAAPKKKAAARKAKPATKADAAIPPQAVRAKLPLFLTPQLATLVEEPPKGGDWIYEMKFDGYRVVARVEGEDVKLFTRNGNDWTTRIRGLADEIRSLGIASAWLDGEIVVANEKGLPDFQALQRAFDSASTAKILYYVFDLPYFGGYDLRRVPLVERRAMLARIFEGAGTEQVRFSEHFTGSGAELLEASCGKGLEGLIAKRAQAPYESTRSGSWIKLRCSRRQEFVVAGWTDPKGSRSGFGSLLLGLHDKDGRFVYAGNVGTGFDEKLLASIKSKLDALALDEHPFDEKPPRGVKGNWVRPKLVAEVAFTEWTADGRIRHPVFHGLRTDKDPQSITREKALEKPPPAATATKAATSKAPRGAKTVVGGIAVSSPERVVDPSTGLTKLDLVSYYDRAAKLILPHLEDRAATLVRAPAGIEGQRFFQKHADTMRIPGIRELDRSLWPGHDPMIEVATKEALLGAAQMNVVEFHTMNATTRATDKPDRFILDLDPGKGVKWATVREATALVKQMLDLLGLESFLKTSGGKGLHVVVPIAPRLGWDEVKDFTEAMVVHLATTIPKLFVSKSGESNRVGKIFVDYLRNSSQASTVAAFSARARPGMGVSVPVRWDELEKLESAAQWTIANIGERLEKVGNDPWKDYRRKRQSIAAAMKRLAGTRRKAA